MGKDFIHKPIGGSTIKVLPFHYSLLFHRILDQSL